MRAENLFLSFGTTVVYDNAEFHLSARDKCGIVGVNGAGKSTLLKLILGQIQPDAGHIETDGARIGYLPQVIEIDDPDITVWDFLLSGRPIAETEQALSDAYTILADNPDDATAADTVSRIQAELDKLEPHTAENTLLELIDKMGIHDTWLNMRLCDLSGGQKSRVAFTRMLYSMPDIMLLDEPTNHLDAETRDFVGEFLKKYRGMILMVSHDTALLNIVTTKIMSIDKVTHKIDVWDGNYDAYQNKMRARKHAADVTRAAMDREIKRLDDIVRRANAASPSNHALKRMGRTRAAMRDKIMAARTARDTEYKKLKMDLSPRAPGAKNPILVDDLWFRYPGEQLMYRKLSFYITGGERFLITGANGTGKSTLLKLILGQLTPERGTIDINPKTDIAYYAQELQGLAPDKTILENVETADYTELQLRAVLGNFLFTGMDVFKKVSTLSPGERARVALCKLLLKRANLLILDEPTNHLDPDTVGVIADNFRDFPGTIILVSHNPDFIDQIGITRVLELPAGRIQMIDAIDD